MTISSTDVPKKEYVSYTEKKNQLSAFTRFMLRYSAWRGIPYDTVCSFMYFDANEKAIWQCYYTAVVDVANELRDEKPYDHACSMKELY